MPDSATSPLPPSSRRASLRSENVLRAFPRESASRNKGGEMISRREFIAATGAAVTVSSVAGATLPESAPSEVALSRSASAPPAEKSSRLFLADDDLKPATYDRLPLEWHKQRARLLQEKLAQDGRDGILLT